MPLTMVQKTIGAIIIFTSLTKPSPSGLSDGAEIGPVVSDGDAERQADEDLDVEKLDQLGGLHGLSPGVGMCGAPVLRRLCTGRRDVCGTQRSVASTRSTITPDWPR